MEPDIAAGAREEDVASVGAMDFLTMAFLCPLPWDTLSYPWKTGQLPSQPLPTPRTLRMPAGSDSGAARVGWPPFQVLGQELAHVNGAQKPLYICRVSMFDVINIILIILLL